MTLADTAASFFPDNAIARAELTYQNRSGRYRRWQRWIGRILMGFGITMSMILYWGEFAGALLQRDAGPIGDTLSVGTAGLLALALIYHFVLMLQTLSFSANSIARERQNHTWDMLVLTGVDARQIVRGKWWATVQRQWRSYLLLGILRVGAIVWFSASTSRDMLNYINNNYYMYANSYLSNIVVPSPLSILFAGGIILAFTMINLGFTAACGVLASAQIRRSALALGRSIALRLLTILSIYVVVLGIPALVGSLTHGVVGLWFSIPGASELLGRCLFTLLDNGVSLASEFSRFRYTFYDYTAADTSGYAVLSMVMTIVVYLLLTRFLLGRAQRQTVRQQALPPEKLPQQNRKIALS